MLGVNFSLVSGKPDQSAIILQSETLATPDDGPASKMRGIQRANCSKSLIGASQQWRFGPAGPNLF